MPFRPFVSRRVLLASVIFAVFCVGALFLFWGQEPSPVRGSSFSTPVAATGPTAANATEAAEAKDSAGAPVSSVAASTLNPKAPREMDLAVNPYAGGLIEPGKSKRKWDVGYIQSFLKAKDGDPVTFELTNGVMAVGNVHMINFNDAGVSYVSGELTAPEKGKFFFLTPPEGGKAGKAVGVVEFPESKTAYRVEPTGPDGDPELWQRRLDEVVCLSMAEADPDLLAKEQAEAEEKDAEEIVPLRPDEVPDYVPSYNAGIVSLQSYPGAQGVMLLDFAGGYTASWGGVNYTRPDVSNDTIKDIWKRIAEDYMGFNINVTTDIKVFLAAPAASRQRCCYTTTPITPAGVAYFGSWNWGNDTVCWSVYNVGKAAAEVGAHEVGHTLGLAHQGQTGGGEYYGGQGGGEVGWAPIMGVGYYQALTTWAKGEYQNANQPQDELQTITTTNNNVAYRIDDTGATLAASRYLDINNDNTVFAEGVIERTADTDAFQFTTTGGAVSLTVDPVAPGDWGDLATMATLADATDTVISTTNVQNDVSSTITSNLAAGTYTFRVTGTGKNDPVTNGFSSYASLGYYSISGSVAGARLPTRLSVNERAPNNTVVGTVPATNPNGSPLVYTITGGNTGTTFTVDNTGVVRVANNSLLDYYALAANPALYQAQFEVFMNITNTNNPSLSETKRRVVIAVNQLYAPVPTALTATLDSSLRVNLEWSETYGTVSYNLKRSTVQGGPYTTVASTTAGKYTDAGLIHGVTYYYVVTAVNANGESNNSAEAKVLALAVAGGFESPVLGSGHRYNPTGGGGWTFNGEAGIISNGSAFSAPNAPEGVQAAFIQRNGSLLQTFGGFTPGISYTITYVAAQRGGNSQTWNTVIDGNVIKANTLVSNSYAVQTATFTATAAFHSLSFVGTNLNGGDNTIFIDDVQISAATPAIPNFSFETPNIGTGSGSYQYNPSGGSWTFSGSGGNGSGLAGNGSGFNNPNAPHGTQTSFVQSFGTITQSLSGFTPGKTYTLSYFAAQRPGNQGGQTWNVKINNTVIQSNGAGGTSFTAYKANFVASAATQTLSFVGTNLSGGDRTVFIDYVSLVLPIQPVAAAVAITSPGDNSAFGASAPVSLTATVAANGNLINGVQYFVDNAMIGQISSAPYTCAWGNATGGKHSAYARVLFNNGSVADSVPINFVVANVNLNLGFETPGIGNGNYNYRTSGAAWTFSGTGASGSGIVANGSVFSNPNAPEGSQAAFVQQFGSFAQTIAGFTPGTSYTISYSAAQRSTVQNGGETWDVAIDGNVIKSNIAGATTYTAQTATFTATAGFHTLSFVGTNLNGGDNTVFIDNLSFNPPLSTNQGPKLVVNSSPATAVDVVASDVSFVAAFTSPLSITYQWQKIVNGQVFDVPGATTPALNLANLQLGDAGSYRLQASSSAGVSVSSVSQLTVNSPPAAVSNVINAYAAQTGLGAAIADFSPSWIPHQGNLISTKVPTSVGSGSFTQSTNVLTDGGAGRLIYASGGASASQVTAGGSAGQSVTYNLGTAVTGYDLSSIVVHGGWCDAGRDQQAYTVSYSTVSAPTTFIQLAVVDYNPSNPGGVQSATRSTLTSATSAPLASSVAALKFDFTTPAPENGYCGYTEISVFGTPFSPAVTMQTTPATARDVVGGQVTFTASIAGAANLSYQWQKVVGGVPSDIGGALSQTLTLTNLQIGDSASYQLKGTNAQGSATSAPAALTVTAAPAAVANVITSMAAQTGLGGNTTFLPSWKLIADNSLIGGMAPSTSAGNFSLNSNGKAITALTTPRTLAINPTGGGDNSINYLSCGNGNGAGSSAVYTLPASVTGHTLTKIMVYGGWSDAGRDQQAYTVSYSKVATPTTFVSLGAVNYNPTNPGGVQSTTRATLTPANGILATNVAAVKFDFTTPTSENGWVGYSQFAVYGAPTPSSAPANLVATAANAGASLSWTGSVGATSYNVKRSTVSGGSYTTVGNVTTPGFVDTGLTNGTHYYYVVTAVNAGGESANSGQAAVTPVSTGYQAWLDAYPSITGTDRAADADPDHDGVANGIEFLTGTSPANGASSSPVTSTVDTSGNLVLQFKRVVAAKSYTVAVDVSTDLQVFAATYIVPTGATTGPPVTVVENGTAADDITIVIPRAAAAAKFARVRILIPSSP